MNKYIILSAVFFFYLKSFAFGASYSLGEPKFYGSGCKKDTTAFTLSPDAAVLSILFDDYKAEISEDSRSITQSKNCIVVVPIKLPKGMQIGVSHLDYRGYISLPDSAKGEILSSISMVKPHAWFPHFYHHLHSSVSKMSFRGPADEEFNLNHQSKTIYYSSCGGTAYLLLNSNIMLRSNRDKEYSLLTMDSVDISHEQGTSLHFKKRSCR